MDDWIDQSRYPLVVQTFPPTFTAVQLHAAFDRLDALMIDVAKRQERIQLLVDIRPAKVATALHRKRIAETFTFVMTHAKDCIAGQAFVVLGSGQKGALTAVLWLAAPPWPIRVCSTLEEGADWLASCR